MCVSLRKLNDMICFLRLHVQLMDLQQKQINALADWLTRAEQKINSSESIGSDLDTVKRQVEDHKVLFAAPVVVIGTCFVVVRTLCFQVLNRCTACQIMQFKANAFLKFKEVESFRLLPYPPQYHIPL